MIYPYVMTCLFIMICPSLHIYSIVKNNNNIYFTFITFHTSINSIALGYIFYLSSKKQRHHSYHPYSTLASNDSIFHYLLFTHIYMLDTDSIVVVFLLTLSVVTSSFAALFV